MEKADGKYDCFNPAVIMHNLKGVQSSVLCLPAIVLFKCLPQNIIEIPCGEYLCTRESKAWPVL